MDETEIIKALAENKNIFKSLLNDTTEAGYLWKQNPKKWCLLEIICHLCDEEREDFYKRTKHLLETPRKPFSPIDPVGWVQERKYLEQNFDRKLQEFLALRQQSVEWLQALESPPWENAMKHPKFGLMTAKLFLSNWLAHDYLHFRQIVKLRYDYLQQHTQENLTYAGKW